MKRFLILILITLISMSLTFCRYKLEDGKLVKKEDPLHKEVTQIDSESNTDIPKFNLNTDILAEVDSDTEDTDRPELNLNPDPKSDSDDAMTDNAEQHDKSGIADSPKPSETKQNPSKTQKEHIPQLGVAKQSIEFAATPSETTKTAIMNAFNDPKLRLKCYNSEVKKRGNIFGKITISILAHKDGRIRKVEKVEDEIGGEMFTCQILAALSYLGLRMEATVDHPKHKSIFHFSVQKENAQNCG